MAEYIEREAVFKIVADMMCDCKVRHKGRAINRNIKQLPTADVVTVVRCGECEHFKEYPIIDTSIPSGWGKCMKINMDIDLTINDYCSYAERRCEE